MRMARAALSLLSTGWQHPRLQGPSTIAPSVLAEVNKEVTGACHRRPEEKVRFVFLLHIWGEGASNPVRQHQWSSNNWLATPSESTWPIRMASRHDRKYMHVRGFAITISVRVDALGAARLLGWKSRKLKPRILILKGCFNFSRNLAPPKIIRHTVSRNAWMYHVDDVVYC